MNTAASDSYKMSGGQGFAIPIGHAMGVAGAIRGGAASNTVHIGPTAFLGLGVVPPDFIVSNTIGQQEGLLAVAPADARLVTALGRKVKEAGLSGDWQDRCRKIVETEVYPALHAQLDTLKALKPPQTAARRLVTMWSAMAERAATTPPVP